jgi:hypothetical protein
MKDIVGVIVGATAVTAGFIIINGPGSDTDIGKAIGLGLLATFLVACGIMILSIGMIFILVRNDRIKQIKEVLKIPEVKPGILNCPVNYITGANNNPATFGVTVTFAF